MNLQVAQAFEAYPPILRDKLLALRELIFRTAAATEVLHCGGLDLSPQQIGCANIVSALIEK
jgi:hypothetical protein